MRPNAAFEIIDCSGNSVCSEDHRLFQRLNLQRLHKCSNLGWPFGASHHYYILPGTVDKTFNTYNIWKKKHPLQRWSTLQVSVLCFLPALLHVLERVSWTGQVPHWKIAEFLPFLQQCHFQITTKHMKETTMVCDYDSSNKDHWTFPSDHAAIWL